MRRLVLRRSASTWTARRAATGVFAPALVRRPTADPRRARLDVQVRLVTEDELDAGTGPRSSAARADLRGAAAGKLALLYRDGDGLDARVDGGAARAPVVRELWTGVGAARSLGPTPLASAVAAAVQRVRELGRLPGVEEGARVQIALPTLASLARAGVAADNELFPLLVRSVVKSALLSNSTFSTYLTPSAKGPVLVESFELALHPHDADASLDALVPGGAATVEAAIADAALVADATAFARDLANQRADVLHPQALEDEFHAVARSLEAEAQGTGAQVRVHTLVGTEALEREGLRMLAAVGQAARHGPRLLVLEYHNPSTSSSSPPSSSSSSSSSSSAPGSRPVLVLGKGLTFDSGGLNLKPTGSMEEMHMDMSGAAATLAAAHVVGRRRLPGHFLFALAVAENAIDSLSYKPHAILHSHKGPTVEVGNTDAEGRLCLADAMSYLGAKYRPHSLLELSTLTGACVVGLGEHSAGLFTNDPRLRRRLLIAGRQQLERVWPLPIFPEHEAELQSAFADTKSTGKSRFGGACTAAAFLKKFVPDDCTWAHVDIAGPAMPSETRSFVHRGGSGFGAALLAQYLLRFGDQPLPRADSDEADLPVDPAVPSDLRVLFGPRPEGLELELAR